MEHISREWENLNSICKNIREILSPKTKSSEPISMENIARLVSDLHTANTRFNYSNQWESLPDSWKSKIRTSVLECNHLIQLHMKLISHEISRVQTLWNRLKGEHIPEKSLTYEKPKMQNR